jgi:hypothetical protein
MSSRKQRRAGREMIQAEKILLITPRSMAAMPESFHGGFNQVHAFIHLQHVLVEGLKRGFSEDLG